MEAFAFFAVFVVIATVAVAMLYYFIRTVLIMGNHHIGWAIAGFIINPFAHIAFYVRKKQQLLPAERTFFKRFFIAISIHFLIVLFFFFLGAAILSQVSV